MDVDRVFCKLRINNRLVERNFVFELFQSMNDVNQSCFIKMKKDYIDANDIQIKELDKIELFTALEQDNLIKIFEGEIIQTTKTKTEYTLLAVNNREMYNDITETLEDINISLAFKRLANVNFNGSDVIIKRVVFSRNKIDEFVLLHKTLERITGKRYFYYYDNKTIVLTETLNGQKYIVDDNVYRILPNQIYIFPIPELKICDSLVLNNKQYNIDHFVWTNHYIAIGVTTR